MQLEAIALLSLRLPLSASAQVWLGSVGCLSSSGRRLSRHCMSCWSGWLLILFCLANLALRAVIAICSCGLVPFGLDNGMAVPVSSVSSANEGTFHQPQWSGEAPGPAVSYFLYLLHNGLYLSIGGLELFA